SVPALVGMIGEMTEDLPDETGRRRLKQLTCMFGPGTTSATTQRDEHDVFTFDVTEQEDFKLPASFGGASGGAIWKFYVKDKDGAPTVIESRLVGVAFFETPVDGKMIVTCHGPKSIYGALADAVAKQWPEEFKLR